MTLRLLATLTAAATLGGCITESTWDEHNSDAGDAAVERAAPTGTWGSPCAGAGSCAPGLSCLVHGGKPTYCTRTCNNVGPCSGTPGSTFAVCQGAGGGKRACVFLCRASQAGKPPRTFPCPPKLTCQQTGGLPGTHICVP